MVNLFKSAMKIDWVKHREDTNLTLRKGAISEMINKKRYATLATQYKSNNFVIDANKLNPDMFTYYNGLDSVRVINA